GTHFGGIEVAEHAIHVSPTGHRYLVVHGDNFDLIVTQARWLALLGDKAYDFSITINRVFNMIRRRLGFGYWSLSKWAKFKVKNAVNFIGDFERTLAAEAARHGVEGVICGHIHHATMHHSFGVHYVNCGDWVESCTAIAEHHDGRFEIITWTRTERLDEREPTAVAAQAA
ncbi:MAG: UDP-2,3-diacylglucosamine diphosphatase, partial [Rhodoplanes sp.]